MELKTSEKDLIFDSEVKSYDPESHSIVSFISTSTPDYGGDEVDPAGLELKRLSDGQPKRPAVLFGHNDNLPAVGKCLWIKKEGNGLVAKTQFADTERGRELEYLYANKFMTDFSIRLLFDEKGIKPNKHGGICFKKYTIPEYSFVNMGMNFEAVSKSKSFTEIKEAAKSLKDKEIKMIFEKHIQKVEMENKIKDLESDLSDLKSRMDALESRIDAIENPDKEEDPNVDENKEITIDDFNSIKELVFTN